MQRKKLQLFFGEILQSMKYHYSQLMPFLKILTEMILTLFLSVLQGMAYGTTIQGNIKKSRIIHGQKMIKILFLLQFHKTVL